MGHYDSSINPDDTPKKLPNTNVSYTNKFRELLTAIEPIVEGYQTPYYIPSHGELDKLIKTFKSAKRYLDNLDEGYIKYKNRK